MLKIETVYIKRIGEKSRLCADIRWSNRSRTLWFEVEREFENYLCYERADGFLIALLPFAMINNLDIEVEGNISERLLYQLKNILLPALSSNLPTFHFINIKAKANNEVLTSQNAVGTGLTCGIDSFYTILKHLDNVYEGFKLTHITFFNIMNSNLWKYYGEESSRDFYNSRIEYMMSAVKDLGLKFVAVDTNFDLFYHELDLLQTFSYRYFGVVLALQKLFKTYYWSSSHSASEFKFSEFDISYLDMINIQCISNENTVFYSAGAEVTRLEKTKYISDFDITYKYLNVCWLQIHNCTSSCDKCKRTMLSLYALGKLDHYNQVFDLEYFYNHLDKYIGYMVFGITQPKMKEWYDEIFRCYLDNNLRISSGAKNYSRKRRLYELRKKIMSLILIK